MSVYMHQMPAQPLTHQYFLALAEFLGTSMPWPEPFGAEERSSKDNYRADSTTKVYLVIFPSLVGFLIF